MNKFFVSEDILPQTLSVLKTRAIPIGVELVVGNHKEFDFSEAFYGAIVQYPGKHGQVYDYTDFTGRANAVGIKVAVAADILSLVKLKAPAEFGADVVVGTTQRFGIPLGYGGPHAGYFATKSTYKRSIPGRIIGVTKDRDGSHALRMALQTREQHIKRKKPLPIFVPRKYCWRSWLECMQSTMGKGIAIDRRLSSQKHHNSSKCFRDDWF